MPTGRQCRGRVCCYHHASVAKFAPAIRVTEPRAGFPVPVSKAALATPPSVTRLTLRVSVSREPRGDHANVQAAHQGIVWKAGQGQGMANLRVLSPGDSPNSWAECLHAQWSPLLPLQPRGPVRFLGWEGGRPHLR